MNFSLFAAIQRSLILFSVTFWPVSPVWAQASLAIPTVDALERTLRSTWVGALEYRDCQFGKKFELPVTTRIDVGADDVIAPEKLQRIKRQVYVQENGIESYAAATANGKSPNLSASAVPPVPLLTPADVRTMVVRHIDSNATLDDVRREDDRYVLTPRVTARGQVTRTMETLTEDAAFVDVQEHGIVTHVGQMDLATIDLKRRR